MSDAVFLLDALALIYRAHFAFLKNPRRNAEGVDTGAILGFANALVEVLQKKQPHHIAVVFDTPAPTFRQTLYPAYKAHREAQPESITQAIPYIKAFLQAFHIPVLAVDGFEADDVLGTLAQQAAKEAYQVYLMTPDKDFGQLVSDQIHLYQPAKGGIGARVLDVDSVVKKWGIAHPDQVRDMLGLEGDASDNIPGVPGIGRKTAQKLIQQFGTLEKAVAEVGIIPGKLGERLKTHQVQALLSKKLATIRTDLPLAHDFTATPYATPDTKALVELCSKLGFRSLQDRLLGGKRPQQASLFGRNQPSPTMEGAQAYATHRDATLATTPHQYHLAQTEKEIHALLKKLSEAQSVCIDTETTSLDPYQAQLLGIAFSFTPHEAFYLPLPASKKEVQDILRPFLPFFSSTRIEKVGQNLKYDLLVLHQYGIQVAPPFFDTMVAQHLVAPDQPRNLNSLARHYLQYEPIPIEQLIGPKGKGQQSMSSIPLPQIKDYACEDADLTLQLRQKLGPMLKAQGLHDLLSNLEMSLLLVLVQMEAVGIKLDVPFLEKLGADFHTTLQQHTTKIHALAEAPFNIDSPKQLGEVLFGQLQLVAKPTRTKTGQYATSEAILQRLKGKHPIIDEVLAYRSLKKLSSTYVDVLPKLVHATDNRLHTSFNQATVSTGRLSSSKPNLQNIPIRTAQGYAIRQAFVAKKGCQLLCADYSQIELRLMAAFAQDEAMLKAFHSGEDIHAATAQQLFNMEKEAVSPAMRRKAKMVNFGIIYGISPFGLAQRLGISRTEAGEIIARYFARFPAIKAYMNRVVETATAKGYVTTQLGRRRYLPDLNSRNATQKGFATRNAINMPIQGTAAELIKKAMINIDHWLKSEKLATQLVLQVHDELLFEVPEAELPKVKPAIKRLMENVWELGVPLAVNLDIGPNWKAAH